MKPTPLLNDDGTASMATMIMLSHHAFRRDLAYLRAALQAYDGGGAGHLREGWEQLTATLHGHHEKEDEAIFPNAVQTHPELKTVVAELSAQHTKIDPALARGAAAFAGLPGTLREAAQAVAELSGLLDAHLDYEEATIIPTLRNAREFPPPANDAEADLYAGGFAWALGGIAGDVTARVLEMLPESVRSRVPAARRTFDAERARRPGAVPHSMDSRTSIPSTQL